MARFNRFLKGWLGLLDAKVGGFTPADTEDRVRPTLGTYPFLYAQVRELVTGGTGTIASTAEGFNPVATLVVPDNEIWFVEHATVTGTILAGDEAIVAPSVQIRSRSLGIKKDILLGTPNAPGSVTFAHQPAAILTKTFIALPGDEFGVWAVLLDYAVAVEFTLSMLIARSQV